MRNKKSSYRFVLVLVLIVAMAALPISAGARHAWGKYHWARTANPFTLRVIDSMTTDWDDNLDQAMADWSQSTVLDLTKEAGNTDTATRQNCVAVQGKVHSCNYTYGTTGWSGLAQIWLTTGNHIIQGTAKMNDTYLANAAEVSKQHVICQEIGHDWGLDHQSETGADLNTCMDYADAFDNPSPNQGDYDQLLCIYDPAYKGLTLTAGPHRCRGTGHLDNFNSMTSNAQMPAGFANANVHAQDNWGEKVEDNGKFAVFVRDFGGGYKIVTFVTWAQ
jgi:hypothetical protein